MDEIRSNFEKFITGIKIPEDLSTQEESKIVSSIYAYTKEITPQNLYRYRTCSDNHIQALKNDKLLLTKPIKFNDPYDALLYINKERIINEIVNSNTEKSYNHFEKLLNDPDFKEQEIARMGEGFVNAMLQNWTDNGKVKKLSPFQIGLAKKSHIERVNQIVDLAIKALKQSSLVACFSEDINSILMWSHYSLNHTGFSLCYDFKSLFNIDIGLGSTRGSEFVDKKIFPVIYSDKRLDATYYAEFHFMDDLYRRMGIPFPYPFYDKLFYYKCLLYKSTDWSYEKEWRIIKQTNLNIEDDKPDYIFIDNIKPKEIYLGSQIGQDDRKKLLDIAKEKNIDVFQMILNSSEHNYKLSKEKIQ